jgi:carboxynorspermidine decarboxylase
MKLETPYYLIDEKKLLRNLKKIAFLREAAGVKSVLALKCFSTWAVFPLMKKYMDGTTSSSLYEARLGKEKFGKETHAYCVAFSDEDIRSVSKFADKIIFNSVSQLGRYYSQASRRAKIGIRVNPNISYSHFDLANPARRFSRLGITDTKQLLKILPKISGAMFHYNCENNDFKNFCKNLDYIAETSGVVLKRLEWVSLGGGFYFTQEGYPLEKFASKLKEFSEEFGLQVYLEPGEAAITGSAELVTKVLDIVRNKSDIAIVDASTEAHMLDLLIYRIPAKINSAGKGKYKYTVAGRSCLAGDIFGTYHFNSPLKAGSILRLSDAAGYTMVKKNWFNGLQMPSIVIKRIDGTLDIFRTFSYNNFVDAL